MSLISRLFPSSHVRDALGYLDSLDGVMANQMAWDSAKARARKMLADNPQTVRETVVVDGLPIRQIVLNVVSDLMAQDLHSGRDHVGRGRLGMIGSSKKAIFGLAIAESAKAGFLTDDDARAAQAGLNAGIAEEG